MLQTPIWYLITLLWLTVLKLSRLDTYFWLKVSNRLQKDLILIIITIGCLCRNGCKTIWWYGAAVSHDLWRSVLACWENISYARVSFGMYCAEISLEFEKQTWEAPEELPTVVALSPLTNLTLSMELEDTVLCTDASLQAGTVVYTTLGSMDPINVWKDTTAELEELVKNSHWKLVVQHSWRKPATIHLLEGEAVIIALKWLLRTQDHFCLRVIIFTNRQSV